MNTKEIIRPAAVLLVITVVAGGVLGAVQSITKPAIDAQNAKSQAEAMQKVFAEADEFKAVEGFAADGIVVDANGAYKGGELCGYVIEVKPSGFGGEVDTLVGVDTEGAVTGLVVMSHSETPGLGAKATDEAWAGQFAGMTGADLAVTKDGGKVQAITSATITSRAVSEGAKAACDWVAANGGAK